MLGTLILLLFAFVARAQNTTLFPEMLAELNVNAVLMQPDAKHIIGGILRDVTLYALPESHIGKFYIETDFDKEYKDAILKLKITSQSKKKLDLKIRLEDTTGRNVLADSETITLLTSVQNTEASITVPAPVKWDAEHPVLYKLQVDVYDSGKKSYSFTRKVGFRKVEVEKNIFKVNGHPVKLRAACWHNIHPTLGRVSTLEYELKDIELVKKANVNFFRTSHYAPSERFVELCDEHGIYIEAESAACFVNINRPSLYGLGKTESDPAYM